MSPPTKIENLEEIIKESIVGEIVEQKLEALVPPGENFGSVIYKVDLKVKNEGEVETYHAVAKCTPPNKMTQEMMNIQQTVKAEIAWYTTIIPTIRNFQQECGVEQVADFFQNFYGSRINLDPNSDVVDINAVILTENLKPLGFENIDRYIGFDLKTSKAILRDLATFHAVPMAIKIKNKELFEKNIKPHLPGFNFQDNRSTEDEDVFKDLKKVIAEIPETTPYTERIASYLKNNKPYVKQPITKEPWGSICHNDFWINNIMVKDEDNPKTIFLDFQIATYGSIAIDVIFFLIVSVAKEVITEHMDELIKYYWDEFLKNLKQLNIDTSIFTFEDFLKEIDDAATSGLFGRALFHILVIMMDRGHAIIDSSDENFKREDFTGMTFNDRHREKYKWLVLEFVKRGFENIDRYFGFDLKRSKAILRDLAAFHAVPMAIKIKNKELFEKNIKQLFNVKYPYTHLAKTTAKKYYKIFKNWKCIQYKEKKENVR